MWPGSGAEGGRVIDAARDIENVFQDDGPGRDPISVPVTRLCAIRAITPNRSQYSLDGPSLPPLTRLPGDSRHACANSLNRQ